MYHFQKLFIFIAKSISPEYYIKHPLSPILNYFVNYHANAFALRGELEEEFKKDTFIHWGHLNKTVTAPWLNNLVEYSYVLPKYSVKISREEKKLGLFFLFHFL